MLCVERDVKLVSDSLVCCNVRGRVSAMVIRPRWSHSRRYRAQRGHHTRRHSAASEDNRQLFSGRRFVHLVVPDRATAAGRHLRVEFDRHRGCRRAPWGRGWPLPGGWPARRRDRAGVRREGRGPSANVRQMSGRNKLRSQNLNLSRSTCVKRQVASFCFVFYLLFYVILCLSRCCHLLASDFLHCVVYLLLLHFFHSTLTFKHC